MSEQAGFGQILGCAPDSGWVSLLYRGGPASIVALSERLRISHPAVVQIARER